MCMLREKIQTTTEDPINTWRKGSEHTLLKKNC